MGPSASAQPRLPTPQFSRRIAVIGGGISGLTAAHRICELDSRAEVVLFEAGARVGGVLQTECRDGWLLERSADMFTTREPWAFDLCERLGIADELIETDDRFRRAFVVRGRRLIPVPPGFTLMAPAKLWPMVTTPILSPLGKLRMAVEPFIRPRRDDGDESLESFVVRRLGREAFDRLIQPLIGGIYTADPSKLSMRATLPQFVEMERECGSLIRGVKKQATTGSEQGTGARYGQFVAPRTGMYRLVEAIVARLPIGSVRLNTTVRRIERNEHWRLFLENQEVPEEFDELILAAPGTVSSRLLVNVNAELAQLIGQIQYAGCSVALVGARRDQIAHSLNGFGFVVPAIERRRFIACSMASVKFPGRAPEGKVLLRVFVGGALQPELVGLSDQEMRGLVMQEICQLIGFQGQPEFFEIARWPGMMPQYHVGHLELVRQIEDRAVSIPHFALAGNAYRGVGVPFCVKSGEEAAESIVKQRPLAAV
jgi:protoporphyrinogen/coproporphyrinogen III oxidase